MTVKPTPAAANGIANIPAPMVVPATIKILPRVRFSRFSLSLQQITINYAAQSRGYYGFRQIGITSCVMKCLHNKRAKACASARRGLTVWPKLAVLQEGLCLLFMVMKFYR
ncbi:hypothetical protein EAO18_02675 [Klebsiella pneumoniae]|nr:hypothetical protein EAO18_02675 [Klebsiella pneumoniae]